MTPDLANSPMLRALLAARDDVPEQLLRFDALACAGAQPPSFDEYSARIGESLAPWRRTVYFDTVGNPQLIEVANERFDRVAAELGFCPPPAFMAALRAGAVAGPDVLQIVLGIDAEPERARLKYYLIFKDRSGATVERLRAAVGAPALPPSLTPDSVYILGIDFGHGGPALHDFKLYVRLDPRRINKVIRNLGAFAQLWRGSRYLVFQHCLLGSGRQVYFHASSAELLEHWLHERASHERAAADLARQIADMNASLGGRDNPGGLLRPWIASFPYREGRLLPGPSNLYFHHG